MITWFCAYFLTPSHPNYGQFLIVLVLFPLDFTLRCVVCVEVVLQGNNSFPSTFWSIWNYDFTIWDLPRVQNHSREQNKDWSSNSTEFHQTRVRLTQHKRIEANGIRMQYASFKKTHQTRGGFRAVECQFFFVELARVWPKLRWVSPILVRWT